MAERYLSESSVLQAVGDIHPLDYNGQGIVERIKAIPAADVVEVVRCRECKHHDGIRCFCWNSVIVTRFDDYCSNGERKDGGQDEAPAGPYDLLYEEGGPDA